MSEQEVGQARISYPDPDVEDAVVPASAVPHWERAGWSYIGGARETWPEGMQLFEGQPQVRLYHPELGQTKVFAESAVPHWRSKGWVPAEEAADRQFEGKTVEELREVARERGLKVSGNKDELLARLRGEPEQASQDEEQAGDQPASDSEEGQ